VPKRQPRVECRQILEPAGCADTLRAIRPGALRGAPNLGGASILKEWK